MALLCSELLCRGSKSVSYQSPRITDFRYYLNSAGCGSPCGYVCMYVCMHVCIYLSGYKCPFDYIHTIQPTALKLWHNIPHVYNSKRFFQILEKKSRVIALFNHRESPILGVT